MSTKTKPTTPAPAVETKAPGTGPTAISMDVQAKEIAESIERMKPAVPSEQAVIGEYLAGLTVVTN